MSPWKTKVEVAGDLGSKTTFWGCKQMNEQRSWSTEGRLKRPCREKQTRCCAVPKRERELMGESSGNCLVLMQLNSNLRPTFGMQFFYVII